MEPHIQKRIQQFLQEKAFGRFYHPDGVVPTLEAGVMQNGRDRLLFVLSGVKKEKMSLGGVLQTVTLRGGDAYLIERSVWEYADMTHPHELLCIVPRAAYLRVSYYHATKRSERGDPWPTALFHHTRVPPGAALLHVIQALKTAIPAVIPDLLRTALRLALHECEQSVETAQKSAQTYEKILHYVEANFSAPITRESVAGLFEINPSYLSQLFRQMSGEAFSDYLCACRMTHAQKLLKSTQLPVKRIGLLCGYPDEVYFVRRFREVVGIPPGRYRSNHAAPGAE